MTAHPIDTEALRARAAHVYRHGGPANAVESLAANIPEILDRLAAAEHRATRAEAERDRWHSMWRQRGIKHLSAAKRATRAEARADIRGRAVVIYQARAREAEARIKAVQDLIDQADTAGDWTVTCSRLQRAIDGTNPNPYRASETA